ncbi:MAG: hypothetical protein GXP30_04540 [Verrucomicrobia bacterium]|nr:hypothetical protein [Verrucomicrobiota bacterium]
MNTIQINRLALCGSTAIPAGNYTVSVRSDSRQINLESGGRDVEISAIGRPNKGNVRSLDVQFVPGGGSDIWTLLVKTPKMGEYMATITYAADKK